ncbi:Transcriptional regulator, TetR family [hydrothermal vent metagenome]|uniref:Transcriptional regulator, TetR family n=1 Tax=hydrothermal vent metagenome TaxID=652676 RepID=A0A1W1CR08_9ZZZZ
MNTKTNSSYHHGNLKEALISESLKMVESGGIASITLRELTNRLGTSRTALYRHFVSKEELLQEVIQAGFEKLDTYVFSTLDSDLDLNLKLHDVGKAYIDFAIKNPNLYRMIFGHELKEQREESCDINEREDAPGFHNLVDIIIDAQNANIVKKDDAFMQATVMWSMLHGLSNLLIDGHVHIVDNIDTLFELSFKTLISGIALEVSE